MKNYKQYKKAKKEQNAAKVGQVAGTGVAAIGAGALGGSAFLKKTVKSIPNLSQEQLQKLAEAAAKEGKQIAAIAPEMERSAKNLKKVGIVALPAGVALTTASTVLRKKSSKKLKEFGDDRSKKKE